MADELSGTFLADRVVGSAATEAPALPSEVRRFFPKGEISMGSHIISSGMWPNAQEKNDRKHVGYK